MRVTRELKKMLNERIENLLVSDSIPYRRVAVGWWNERVYWAERRGETWCLRSGKYFSRSTAFPRELEMALEVGLSLRTSLRELDPGVVG